MRQVDRAAIIPTDRQALYMTNATFHMTVDTFADMIPHFIEGLAVHAEKVDDWMQQQTRMAMTTANYKIPPLPDFSAGE